MLHVRMKHGKGDPQKAADYLLSDKDHTGKSRSVKPEILDGDPNNVAKIASMTTRAHKYATGALAFRDTEKPTLAQQQAVMRDFEATFLPGLEKDKNYAIAWVAHCDKGNLELNYFLATTELTTGKQLNPFPPGTLQHEFNDAWVQNTNQQLGYDQVVTDPLKISRSKFEQKILPLKEATAEICQQAKSHKEIRDNLEEIFKSAIEHDEIKSRQEIIDLLKEHGDITRVGNDYISFKPESEAKAIRLKGPVFEEGADYKELKEKSKEYQLSKQQPKDLTQEQFKQNKEKIDRLKNSRLEYFKKQYQQKEKKVRTFGPKSMQAKKPASPKSAPQPQQQPDGQPEDAMAAMKRMMEEVRQENQESLKKQESLEKLDNKKQEAAKPQDPIVVKSNSSKQAQPTRNDHKPAIASFGQVATGSRAAFFTIQINHVLASKHSLEMQIGSLSMFKLSDIVKKQELMRQIYLLQQQIEVLKAQQEQAATAELIQQQAARYKNTTTPKPKWV
ncbi:relaxase/mobilization nuclease domain-containing protein [Snodgrassella sp. CFCC 13594]|uniref:relaxase/mobilization nuclease domain-containing protein n=1 Tax=Snodgrassella sp. CFCC 13594 TaxID=1775559 RepID=UPI000831B97E|nr:relaxase/mobilization nuclease domain-containing protein [Snodgrassella sp. CFCC 13594]